MNGIGVCHRFMIRRVGPGKIARAIRWNEFHPFENALMNACLVVDGSAPEKICPRPSHEPRRLFSWRGYAHFRKFWPELSDPPRRGERVVHVSACKRLGVGRITTEDSLDSRGV